MTRTLTALSTDQRCNTIRAICDPASAQSTQSTRSCKPSLPAASASRPDRLECEARRSTIATARYGDGDSCREQPRLGGGAPSRCAGRAEGDPGDGGNADGRADTLSCLQDASSGPRILQGYVGQGERLVRRHHNSLSYPECHQCQCDPPGTPSGDRMHADDADGRQQSDDSQEHAGQYDDAPHTNDSPAGQRCGDGAHQ